METYQINDIFYSLQGEGNRVGSPNIFIRFSGCNQTCSLQSHGFNCDTEFVSGRKLTISQILKEIKKFNCQWIILTGGEPALQTNNQFLLNLKNHGYKIAIETNGSIKLPSDNKLKLFDWITVSPKVAEHAIKQLVADEVKYVRNYGQELPKTKIEANYYYISPVFNGDHLETKTLNYCIQLIKNQKNQKRIWQLTMQYHKLWNIM